MYALSFKKSLKMAYYVEFWWSIAACTTYNSFEKCSKLFFSFSILLFIQVVYHYIEYVKFDQFKPK